MKSRTNGSYVYFLIDDHLIYSYKIESHTYITLHDLKTTNHSALYEIKNKQAFQDFEHESSEAVVGTGLFLDEESLKELVTPINKVIKKQKKRETVKEKKAIHLVASQHIASRLTMDLNENIEVIGLDAAFMYGPIRQLDEHYGQRERSEWIFENINREFEDKNPYMIALANKINSLDEINDERPVYIWCGNNIEEQLALRFFIFMLEKKPNSISIINTSEALEKIAPTEKLVVNTAEIKSGILQSIFEHIDSSYVITTNQKQRFGMEWLSITNADELLRIWENQEIIPVNLGYYDQTILKVWKRMNAKERIEYIMASQLIWKTIEEENLYIDPDFLEYRIRHLVYAGVFEMKGIPKNMRRYFVCLKKEA